MTSDPVMARLREATADQFEILRELGRGGMAAVYLAYEIALERTNTEHAPWHIVPSDSKWFRNLTIGHLLLATLEELDPQWPKADFDVEEQRRRIENMPAIS